MSATVHRTVAWALLVLGLVFTALSLAPDGDSRLLALGVAVLFLQMVHLSERLFKLENEAKSAPAGKPGAA